MRVTGVDFRPSTRQPSIILTVLGIAAGVLLSLLVNMLIVHLAVGFWPALADYEHFRLPDYGRLTVLGSLIACAGWPVLTRISSAPVRVYLLIAALGTLVLWLPDLYILFVLHEPAHAVATLMVMHVAVPFVSCLTMIVVARRQ
jgi:hypothetical protein